MAALLPDPVTIPKTSTTFLSINHIIMGAKELFVTFIADKFYSR